MGAKFASIHVYDPEKKMTDEQFETAYLDELHDIEKELQKRCVTFHNLLKRRLCPYHSLWISQSSM